MSTATPFSAGDLAIGLTFGMAILVLFYSVVWRGSQERPVLLVALALKLVASLAYGYIHFEYYFEISDSLTYHALGVESAELIRSDLLEGTVNYLTNEPFFWIGGISTTRFESLCGLVHLFVLDSFIAASFFFALAGFYGQVYLYRFFVAQYPDPRVRKLWQAGVLFFPSLVFWSSGMLKDSLGIYGLGCTLWAVYYALDRSFIKGVLGAFFGAYVLILFRAQIVPVLFLSMGPWVLSCILPSRGSQRRSSRLLISVVLIIFCLVGVWLVMVLESRFSLAELPERFQYERSTYQNVAGGSTVETPGGDNSSWLGIIASGPDVLIYTMFRPYLWEAEGMVVRFAAMENLLLLVLTFRALMQGVVLLKSGPGRLGLDPIFLMCLIFVPVFGLAVGMSTPNLGTVSRYRIPMIPFMVGLLLIIHYKVHKYGPPTASPVRGPRSISSKASLGLGRVAGGH